MSTGIEYPVSLAIEADCMVALCKLAGNTRLLDSRKRVSPNPLTNLRLCVRFRLSETSKTQRKSTMKTAYARVFSPAQYDGSSKVDWQWSWGAHGNIVVITDNIQIHVASGIDDYSNRQTMTIAGEDVEFECNWASLACDVTDENIKLAVQATANWDQYDIVQVMRPNGSLLDVGPRTNREEIAHKTRLIQSALDEIAEHQEEILNLEKLISSLRLAITDLCNQPIIEEVL